MKKIMSVLIGLVLTGFIHQCYADIGFNSSEHKTAGNQVKLTFPTNKKDNLLHLPNSLQLTFGDIVTMGDFYGIVSQPISEGSLTERKNHFIKAFDTFARDTAAIEEMPKILGIIQKEQDAIDDGIKHGEKPQDVFDRISMEDNRLWNCATGGGCGSSWYLQPGRYLQLAEQNYDHFGQNALLAYEAGHAVAMETAILARQKNDLAQLELAYAMEGFADHFLSDRFATGHVRTPRVELASKVTPERIGDLLAMYMHDEENHLGLHVHNLRGDHWVGYGDRYYIDPANDKNSLLLIETLQKSADEVFAAYQTGVATSEVKELIPIADEKDDQVVRDTASLFYWDETSQTLFRRADVYNISDKHWTSDWWGWTTLVLLSQKKPLTLLQQAELVRAGLGKQAEEYGLITNKNLLKH